MSYHGATIRCTCTLYEHDDGTDGNQSNKGLGQTTFTYTGRYKQHYDGYRAPNDGYF